MGVRRVMVGAHFLGEFLKSPTGIEPMRVFSNLPADAKIVGAGWQSKRTRDAGHADRIELTIESADFPGEHSRGIFDMLVTKVLS